MRPVPIALLPHFDVPMNLFFHIGRYSILMYRTFSVPQRWRLFFKQTWKEIEKLGANSLPITLIISVFIGSV